MQLQPNYIRLPTIPTISELYTYPIKSLGGISLQKTNLDRFGLKMDRRFMLIDSNNKFMSQREIPELALFRLKFEKDGFVVEHQNHQGQEIFIKLKPTNPKKEVNVQIWDDNVVAEHTTSKIDAWFSDMLSAKVRLVQMPHAGVRQVDARFAPKGTMTAFSDGFPILLISQASLDDLNEKLIAKSEPAITIDRFRPNIVVADTEAFAEDKWNTFQINGISFSCVKPCARCVVTTIDQQTAIAGKEPLKTLATYRKVENKVLFGQNIIFKATGTAICVGQPIQKVTLR